ncbi:ACP synthase [Streptomyces antibioticus]|uniref:RICIN domain-containing protein n=1 Tax=Streptomyces antibioticus TaxID=1890 RepID=UPI0036A9E39B
MPNATITRTMADTGRRRWCTALLALAMSLGFAFVSAGSAAASSPGDVIGTHFLRNWETGRCLDSNSAGAVYTSPCQFGNGYQTWSVIYRDHKNNDIVMIRNQATGRCLGFGTYLATGTCLNSSQFGYGLELWEGVGAGWNKVELVSSLGGCLDSDRSGKAYVFNPCNGGGFQKWKLGF